MGLWVKNHPMVIVCYLQPSGVTQHMEKSKQRKTVLSQNINEMLNSMSRDNGKNLVTLKTFRVYYEVI